MKKLLLFVAVLGFCQMVFAQSYQITQNSYQKVSVSFQTGELSVEDVSLPQGDFSMISMEGYGSSYAPGLPQLPQLTKLLQIPVCDSVVATVTNAQYTDYDAADLGIHHPVYPSQRTVSKGETNPEFSYNQLVYHSGALFHYPLVYVEKAGVKRNAALANIYVSLVQYNPVTQKIRIYTHVDVEFTFVNADMARTMALEKFSSPLFALDRSLVINKMQEMRDEYSYSPIKYLIIAPSMFESNVDLAAFVSWKRRMGYLVEVAYTSDANVGTTTTSIKNFIQSRYDAATADDPAPTFLLLLGDREQLPAFTGQSDNSHITDLYYATLAGGDNIPDLYYGRLSATTNAELSNQIEKILMYEQYTMPDPTYLGNAVLIAGTDGNFGPTHANGQINYINNNYMNNNNPRYTNVMVHLYECTSQAAQIRSEVSAGTGWVNYTAHGSETGWYQPEFSNSHVSALQNTNKYGLMIGNCCQSGNFKTSVCFGEALMRAEKKGAMGYIGASNNSYWDEDFYWAVGVRSNINANPTYSIHNIGMYDKLFHTHNEAYSNWVSTIGGIMTGGNMAVQSSSSSLKLYYWEIYHCFGDPSVRTYMGIPSTMQVTANGVITTGVTTYSVTVAPYSYVALTQNGILIAAAFADDAGAATLTFSESLVPGDYELTAQAQNYIPYFQNVIVVAPNGPYVVPTLVEASENSVFTPGSTVRLNLTVTNVGVSSAAQVYATLTPNGSLTMLQDSVYVGAMAVNASENRNNAFAFVMPESEDNVNMPFVLRIHWQDTVIVRDVNVRVKLPKVVMKNYTSTVNNINTTNYNPGDQVIFTFTNQNAGHADVMSGSVDLTCNYSGVQVLTNALAIDGLEANAMTNRSFTLRIADTVPDKSLVPLYYHIYYDGLSQVDTLLMLVGGDFVTFETGDFSQYTFSQNNYPWVVTTYSPHTGSYCASSAQNLSNNSNSRMTATVNLPEEAELSFYYRVSSEESYDKFYLYVDGTTEIEVSGEVQWTYHSMMLPAGSHTILFSYEKDYSMASGSDCAWVDDIMLPSTGILVIEDMVDNAGVDVQVYEQAHASVYPNPANDRVIIESESPVQKAVLFDLNGRVVKVEQVNGENFYQLNMSDLTAGFYMLQLTFDNQQIQNLKIIKR